MDQLPKKPNRPVHEPGTLIKSSLERVRQEVIPVAKQEIQTVTKDLSPEQKSEALGNAEAITRSAQSEMLQAPAEQRAAIAEQRVKLLEQRASEENRGFSTGEKIAMAILRAAPVVAASLTPGADMRGAQQGSQQIGQQFNETLEQDRKTKLEGIDKRLGLLSEDEKSALRGQERSEDKAFDLKKMDKQFEQQKYLEQLKQKGDTFKDKATKEKYVQSKVKMIKNDPLYKQSAKELASFDKGFNALINNNPNGYSDIAGMFNFIKSLDDSVVRPSEISLFNEARSLADRAVGFIKNKQTGEQFLQENREKLARVQGLLAKMPVRYLNTMNRRASEGENDAEIVAGINNYLTKPEDILSPRTLGLVKKELEKERLQDESAAPAAPMTLEQKRAQAKAQLRSK